MDKKIKFWLILLFVSTNSMELMQSILVLLRKSLALPAPDTAGYEAEGTPITEDELVDGILEVVFFRRRRNLKSAAKSKRREINDRNPGRWLVESGSKPMQ